MPASLLAQTHAQITDTVAGRLSRRATSVFGRKGEQASRKHVDAALVALEQDIAAGKREAVRTAMRTIIEELTVEELTFADLRFFAQTLRTSVRATIESAPELARSLPAVDEWFFELVLVGSMHFLVQREAALQERAVKLEVHRLESQLAELQGALNEKTELLEMIRQASTPIVPVVEGILVVPLVGTFDAVRAEHLTEKLLQAVQRAHARAAILDISGVPVFDTSAAQLIIRLTRAVRLLGTEVFLVGMSPENARTIVALEVDLAGLQTLATLRDGLAQALVLQRLEIGPMRKK
jgi:anti-anti-sigma factor